MTASKIFFLFCLSFIVGIGVGSFLEISLPVLLGFLISGILLLSLFWSHKKIAVIGFCILFLVLGFWRHQAAELKITNNELNQYNDQAQKITLIGTIIKEPDIRETNIKLIIQPEVLSFQTCKYESRECDEVGLRHIDDGNILITVGRYPEYQYGDKLKIIGQLKTPVEFPDFNYKYYLAKDGIYSVTYYPEIEKINDREDNLVYPKTKNLVVEIYSKILNFKNKLRETIYENLSPPKSLILGAMILGDKRKMSDDLKEKLNRVGLRHITAISGIHISILTLILMQILIGIGFWRNQAFYATLIILFLFILMIGFPASAIRAGIFGLMLLLAQKVGRMKVASRVIVFSAAVMLAFNPLLLKLDVGFQLSFLAVIGIVYLGPVFNNWLTSPNFIKQSFMGRKKNPIRQLINILAMTLSAQIFTLPILIYNFGRFSLAAPITNILIVPLLSIIMISGFIFVLLGTLLPFLAWILSLFVWPSLAYIIGILNFFSQFSFSNITLNIHWGWLIIAYIILGFLTSHLYKKATLPDYIY